MQSFRPSVFKSSVLTTTALSLLSCGARHGATSALKEAPDLANLRGQFGLTKPITWDEINANKKIKLAHTPWTDTYWPLVNKELAARWRPIDANSGQEVGLAAFLQTYLTESAKNQPSSALSPAEKYDIVYQARHNISSPEASLKDLVTKLEEADQQIQGLATEAEKKLKLAEYRNLLVSSEASEALTMTSNGWSEFLHYSGSTEYKYLGQSGSEGSSWSWMGICHGWSPAAVMSLPPKHAALATIGEKSVLFTEGDIRGLVSRAWAQQAPYDKNFFLGRRCNKDVDTPRAAIAANSRGKGYTGTVTIDGKTANFTIVDSLLNLKLTVNGSQASAYRVKLDDSEKEAIIIETFRRYYLADSFSTLVAYLKTGNASRLKNVQAEFSGCWDVNPASFHEILVEQLAKRKTGFVMDRTRTGQVWNQPVYAADFTVGELKKANEVRDIAAAYRASGTVYLVEIKASVSWISEPNRPRWTYPADFDESHSQTTEYEYTLELDENKNVIGGEWGTFKEMNPAGHAPDFLFGYEAGAEPVNNLDSRDGSTKIDYTGIIKKLLECSRSADIDGNLDEGGESIPYKKCAIRKAR